MTLEHFLARSRATSAFQDAARDFLRSGRPNELISFDRYSPPVKVERTLTKMLEEYPETAIERVEINGASGCEFFRGELTLFTAEAERRVQFHWDCKWKAVQAGWTDYFGFPDQTRAAREFGYDCFRSWEEVPVEQAA